MSFKKDINMNQIYHQNPMLTPISKYAEHNSKLMVESPIADAIRRIRKQEITSFHALPISNSNSIKRSSMFSTYKELLGDSLLSSELTCTFPLFDSFFFPKGVIKTAQKLAAEAFGAKATLFITSGSTTSAQIAVDTLLESNSAVVIMDRNCHQSLHFAVNHNIKSVHSPFLYIESHLICANSQRQIIGSV